MSRPYICEKLSISVFSWVTFTLALYLLVCANVLNECLIERNDSKLLLWGSLTWQDKNLYRTQQSSCRLLLKWHTLAWRVVCLYAVDQSLYPVKVISLPPFCCFPISKSHKFCFKKICGSQWIPMEFEVLVC